MTVEIDPRVILQRAFPGMPDSEASDLISLSQERNFPPGAVICHEGARESTFYILLDGEVRVTKWINDTDERVLKHLGPGDFFGEMAIIHNAPRAATITTTKTCETLEVRKEDFARLLENSSSMSIAIVREVSRRLRENDEMAIEDLREKARELAVAYQQLAEIDHARNEFLTVVAHELRTPLMAATGFLQVIRMGMLQGEALNNALETVSRNLQDITSLTNDILFLQEMDLILPEFIPTDIGSLVAAVIDQQRSRAEQNKINLHLQVAPNIPTIAGDPKSLERAISAILDNAIKFSPDGGDVFVEVGYDAAKIWVSIQDNGLGIPTEALPHIFDRFFHMDRMGKHLFRGVGLGLSIARQVIELHHGQIKVDSAPGRGAKFTITLSYTELP
jgi:signal transduction histidine kinase